MVDHPGLAAFGPQVDHVGVNARHAVGVVADACVLVAGDASMVVKLARCCHPLPGDDIFGFVTRSEGVSVHRADCTNAASLQAQPERLIDVEWSGDAGKNDYHVTIQVEGIDRARLLADVSATLSAEHLDILSANISTRKNKQFVGRITFESPDPTHLKHVLAQVRKIPGVYDAFRTTS